MTPRSAECAAEAYRCALLFELSSCSRQEALEEEETEEQEQIREQVRWGSSQKLTT